MTQNHSSNSFISRIHHITITFPIHLRPLISQNPLIIPYIKLQLHDTQIESSMKKRMIQVIISNELYDLMIEFHNRFHLDDERLNKDALVIRAKFSDLYQIQTLEEEEKKEKEEVHVQGDLSKNKHLQHDLQSNNDHNLNNDPQNYSGHISDDTSTSSHLHSNFNHSSNSLNSSNPNSMKDQTKNSSVVGINTLGAVEKEKNFILETIEYAFSEESSIHGLLVHGISGTGKSQLVRSILHRYYPQVKTIELKPTHFTSRQYGRNEHRLRDLFMKAKQYDRAFLLCDEIDVCMFQSASNRGGGSSGAGGGVGAMGGEGMESNRLLRALASELEMLHPEFSHTLHRILFIGITNKIELIPSALRRYGRLDREIELQIPSERDRKLIIPCIMNDFGYEPLEREVAYLVSRTHGFLGADLRTLCQLYLIEQSERLPQVHHSSDHHSKFEHQFDHQFDRSIESIDSSRRSLFLNQVDNLNGTNNTPNNTLNPIQNNSQNNIQNNAITSNSTTNINLDDSHHVRLIDTEWIEHVLVQVKPSAIRHVQIQIPNVKWTDIGGMYTVKQQLQESIEWQLTHRDAFERMGIRPPKGILLYGPPGCSKTMMAKALATESRMNFLSVRGPELFSKWVGESERAVKKLFERARVASPCIIFFDEIDGLAAERGSSNSNVGDRVLSQLLAELDGIKSLEHVTLVAATNRPDLIDKALLRPGRIDRMVYVSPPDFESRKSIFNIYLRSMQHRLTESEIEKWAHSTEGYSGAEIAGLCQEAAYQALNEFLEKVGGDETNEIDEKGEIFVETKHFEQALPRVPSRLTEDMMKFYEDFISTHQ